MLITVNEFFFSASIFRSFSLSLSISHTIFLLFSFTVSVSFLIRIYPSNKNEEEIFRRACWSTLCLLTGWLVGTLLLLEKKKKEEELSRRMCLERHAQNQFTSTPLDFSQATVINDYISLSIDSESVNIPLPFRRRRSCLRKIRIGLALCVNRKRKKNFSAAQRSRMLRRLHWM